MCGFIITVEQDVLQPKKRKGVLPLKMPKDSAKNMSVEKLLKEKVLEECKLRDLKKEKEMYLPSEDIVSTCLYVTVIIDSVCSVSVLSESLLHMALVLYFMAFFIMLYC
jgi:hypothetical protein